MHSSAPLVFWSRLDTSGINPEDHRHWLSAEEQDKADRFVFPEHARLYALAHIFMRAVLSLLMLHPPGKLQFFHGAYGKPYLLEGPQINLSHSGPYVALAVSATHQVGVDIEVLKDMSPDTLGAAFSPQERLVFSSLERQPDDLFRFWARKEAVMKSLGLGLHLDPSSFNVGHPAPVFETWRNIDAKVDSDPVPIQLIDLHLEENLSAALAMVGINPLKAPVLHACHLAEVIFAAHHHER
ncbi:4'-phosphopantetheinyl transferase sfp [Pseudovibrio axinellae]|uniref:4'-phosphopantetheinyl transferase sfp n=1 Tax=Pseudovibrio axinellae TaxID=989403 RepID=A0A161XCK6_9HYPH|nr:4'-phosphopantetheinyl transferase superfamily protein [Pseudovibrio axinellae]KZL09093.1 4'-phosphopantetheinyl transferase sfp [Pseudovibrio axinellae]SER75105.1 Phosphopantetheinyl transferase [Pseudovibrio axinellae]